MNQNKNREYNLKKKYGITLEDYERMLKRFDGGCWICGRKPKKRRLCVDHNHKTGEVRGLLCYKCNYGLPWFSDSPELLLNASKYLKNENPYERDNRTLHQNINP